MGVDGPLTKSSRSWVGQMIESSGGGGYTGHIWIWALAIPSWLRPVDSHRCPAPPPSLFIGFRRSEDPMGPRILKCPPPHIPTHTVPTMAWIKFPFPDPPRGPLTPPSRVCDWVLQPRCTNDPLSPPSHSLRIPVCPKSQVPFPSHSFHACYSLTHRFPMASILRSLTILSLITLIYSLIPRPTTSFPIIVLKRTCRGTLTSSPLVMDGLQTFGLAFPLGKPGSLSIFHRGPRLTYVQRRSLRYFLPGHGSRIERSSCGSSTESFVGSFRFRSFLLFLMPSFCRAFFHTNQHRPPTLPHRATTLLYRAAVILHRATVILPSSHHHP